MTSEPDLTGLVDLIGEVGRTLFNLMDNCEEQGPGDGDATDFTIWRPDVEAASAVLDKIDALPFEEPGYILGTGAMLQAAVKQTFAAELAQANARAEQAELALATQVAETERLAGELATARADAFEEAAAKTDSMCGKCSGEGWLWGHELEETPEVDGRDDTRYSCDGHFHVLAAAQRSLT